MALCRRSSRFVVDAFRRFNSNSAPVRFNKVRPRPIELFRWWSPSPNPINKKLITVGLLGSGFASTVYFCNLENVPFTKRSHFVLLSTSTENKISQFMFKLAAEVFEWKIFPSHHPHTIRVQRIGQEIIRALHKELKKEEHSMKTADLEEFEWEFIVVDDSDVVNAQSWPGGKIVVYSGLFDYLKTDAEIAAIIAHEVGHAAARHPAETMSGILWPKILIMFFMPDTVEKMADRFVWLPYFRRIEIEADYIGMLLMASAGYDPRVAIEVCEKFDRLGPLDDEDHLSSHPSEKKRAQLLSQPKVMEEALSLYREALKEKKAEAEKKKEVAGEGEGEGEGDHDMGHMSFFNRLIGVFLKFN